MDVDRYASLTVSTSLNHPRPREMDRKPIISESEREVCRLYPDTTLAAAAQLRLAIRRLFRDISKSIPKLKIPRNG